MMQIKSNLYNNTLPQTSKTKKYDDEMKWFYDEERREDIEFGALVGAVGGGIGGAVLGKIQADRKIKSLPVESVTLTIKEPVYEEKEIGKIPRDYKSFSRWGADERKPEVPVYRKVPVKDSEGNVVYKEYERTFSGHGKPEVKYVTRQVKDPIFEGYDYFVREETEEVCKRHFDHEHCREVTVGYKIRYYPKIKEEVIDTYEEPVIKFETGVNVAKHIIVGGLIGAAVGGVIGGITAAILNKLYESKKWCFSFFKSFYKYTLFFVFLEYPCSYLENREAGWTPLKNLR